MQNKPRTKTWPEGIGLELEEALALLIMLNSLSADMQTQSFQEDIEALQELIGSREIEKILTEDNNE